MTFLPGVSILHTAGGYATFKLIQAISQQFFPKKIYLISRTTLYPSILLSNHSQIGPRKLKLYNWDDLSSRGLLYRVGPHLVDLCLADGSFEILRTVSICSANSVSIAAAQAESGRHVQHSQICQLTIVYEVRAHPVRVELYSSVLSLHPPPSLTSLFPGLMMSQLRKIRGGGGLSSHYVSTRLLFPIDKLTKIYIYYIS